MFGAFAPMPLRLGGSDVEGWAATQHARMAADLTAAVRSAPLAVFTLTFSAGVATVSEYSGQNGVGGAHAPVADVIGVNEVSLIWEPSYRSPLWVDGVKELEHPWIIRAVQCFPSGTALHFVAASLFIDQGGLRVNFFAADGSPIGAGRCVVEVWGQWLPEPAIGAYGGDPHKEDSNTEDVVPYASAWYQELRNMRGSLYTLDPTSLVHAENLALARFLSYFASRLPEKVRANATPLRADESLEYWRTVLAVPRQPGEQKWQLRKACAAMFLASQGNSYEYVDAALLTLLGPNVYVGLTLNHPTDLSTPPDPTVWPVNPGTGALSIGGGDWYSPRSIVRVSVTQPPDMSDGALSQLMNVQMFALLDRLLAGWATWSWYTNDSAGGFLLDISRLDFDRV